MGILEDVMKALERIPGWKRLQETPAQLEALERRVAALEARLAPATGDQCPKCRAMTLQLIESTPAAGPLGRLGLMQDHYQCSSCGYTNQVQRTPS